MIVKPSWSIIGFAAIFVAAVPVDACDCPFRDLPQLFESADFVFSVTLKEKRSIEEGDYLDQYRVAVRNVWKGQVPDELTLAIDKTAGAVGYHHGEEYVAFSTGSPYPQACGTFTVTSLNAGYTNWRQWLDQAVASDTGTSNIPLERTHEWTEEKSLF